MTQPLPIPDACALTAEAVLVDPLAPGAVAEAHMKLCRACAEARVTYLAQEDAPETLAPAGYFDRLPDRVLRKLPIRSSLRQRVPRIVWAAAAALLMTVGAGAFWAGRANRTPLVEATLAKPATENQEMLPDSPFQDGEDALTQLTALSQEDVDAVIHTLSHGPGALPSKQ